MVSARTDKKILGYLGRALSLEFSAVQLFRTQARLLSSWGLHEPAARLSETSETEVKHVDQIIERMLAIGVAPNASQIRPVKLGKSLDDLLTVNIQFEIEVITLYSAAVTHCAAAGDIDNRMFFENLLSDEQVHVEELRTWQNELRSGAPARSGRRSA